MITLDQAKQLKHGDNIYLVLSSCKIDNNHLLVMFPCGRHGYTKPKPIKWRVNGKIKLWKREPNRFEIPLKHGLYDYGYLTSENNHLFNLVPL